MAKLIGIQDLIGVLESGRPAAIREASPNEKPDFVQERDKLATGMSGRLKDERCFSCTFDPPKQLIADRGYIVIFLEGVGAIPLQE